MLKMTYKITFLEKSHIVKIVVEDKQQKIKAIAKVSIEEYHKYIFNKIDLINIMKNALNNSLV